MPLGGYRPDIPAFRLRSGASDWIANPRLGNAGTETRDYPELDTSLPFHPRYPTLHAARFAPTVRTRQLQLAQRLRSRTRAPKSLI